MSPLAFFGLLWLLNRNSSSTAITSGAQQLRALQGSGLQLTHTKTRDKSTTAFPIEVYTSAASGGSTMVLAVASDDDSSFVLYGSNPKLPPKIVRQGPGKLSAAIAAQI